MPAGSVAAGSQNASGLQSFGSAMSSQSVSETGTDALTNGGGPIRYASVIRTQYGVGSPPHLRVRPQVDRSISAVRVVTDHVSKPCVARADDRHAASRDHEHVGVPVDTAGLPRPCGRRGGEVIHLRPGGALFTLEDAKPGIARSGHEELRREHGLIPGWRLQRHHDFDLVERDRRRDIERRVAQVVPRTTATHKRPLRARARRSSCTTASTSHVPRQVAEIRCAILRSPRMRDARVAISAIASMPW